MPTRDPVRMSYTIAPSMAPAAAHFLIGYDSASVGLSANIRRNVQNKMPATSVIWMPEMVMIHGSESE